MNHSHRQKDEKLMRHQYTKTKTFPPRPVNRADLTQSTLTIVQHRSACHSTLDISPLNSPSSLGKTEPYKAVFMNTGLVVAIAASTESLPGINICDDCARFPLSMRVRLMFCVRPAWFCLAIRV